MEGSILSFLKKYLYVIIAFTIGLSAVFGATFLYAGNAPDIDREEYEYELDESLQWNVEPSIDLYGDEFRTEDTRDREANRRFSLSTDRSSYEPGDTIRVSWTAPAGRRSDDDWIGIFRSGASDHDFEDWEYIPDGRGSGTITFAAPRAGNYELRIYLNDGFDQIEDVVAKFRVERGNDNNDENDDEDPISGRNDFTVETDRSSYEPGDTIRVSWTAPRNRQTENDWIGLYRVGASDSDFEDWEYIPEGLNSGTVTFRVEEIGTYEIRIYLEDGYEQVRGATAYIKAVRNASDDDEGEDENEGPTSGRFSLKTDRDLYKPGDTIRVSWTAPAGRQSEYDWIGLYRVGASDHDFKDWEYIPDGRGSGTVSFTALKEGAYEVRLYLNDGFRQADGAIAKFRVGRDDNNNGGDDEDDDDDDINLQCEIPRAELENATNYPASAGPIIAFGDSLTKGVGANSGQDYVSELERLLDIDILNEGESGDTTRDALGRLERDILSKDPSVVIVWLGGNDVLAQYYERVISGLEDPTLIEYFNLLILRLGGTIPRSRDVDEDETFENLEEIMDRIHDSGAMAVLVGFSGGDLAPALESRYRAVAEKTGALFVPNVMRGVLTNPNRMSDLVHPNDEGYEIIAARIASVLACVVR